MWWNLLQPNHLSVKQWNVTTHFDISCLLFEMDIARWNKKKILLGSVKPLILVRGEICSTHEVGG